MCLLNGSRTNRGVPPSLLPLHADKIDCIKQIAPVDFPSSKTRQLLPSFPDVLSQIERHLGTDEATTRGWLGAAAPGLPTILIGRKRQRLTPFSGREYAMQQAIMQPQHEPVLLQLPITSRRLVPKRVKYWLFLYLSRYMYRFLFISKPWKLRSIVDPSPQIPTSSWGRQHPQRVASE